MIFLILGFGLILRLISINQSLWLDEATSAIVSRDLSFGQIISKFAPSDFHPPLYYLLLRLWTFVFGTTEIGIRMLSVVAGLATIYTVYLIGKSIYDKKVGILASILIATSGLHVYYSQEARMYSLETLFTSLAFYFFTKVEEGRKRFWILFSLSLPLIFLTDYLPTTIVLCFWIWGALMHKKFSWWRSFLLSQTPLLLVAVSSLPLFTEQLRASTNINKNWENILGRTTFKEVLLIPSKFIIGRISLDNKFLYPLLLFVLICLFSFVIFVGLKNDLKKMGKIIVLWLFLPSGLIILLALKIPILSYFRLLFILPAFYLLISVGIVSLKYRWKWFILGILLTVNLISTGIYLFNLKFHREDWKGLVQFIEKNRSPGSQVLFVANSQMEGYKYYSKDAKISEPEAFNPNIKEVWLVRYVKDIFDPGDILLKKVEAQGFEKKGDFNFNGIPVFEYKK